MLRKIFDSFDTSGKGSISTATIGSIFTIMGLKVSDEALQKIIADVDDDGSGELEFKEFCTLAAQFLIEEDMEQMEKELTEAFRIFDKEGNGYFTTQVLRELLHELDDTLTDEELDGIIEEVDADGSGTIDFDEFMAMMRG